PLAPFRNNELSPDGGRRLRATATRESATHPRAGTLDGRKNSNGVGFAPPGPRCETHRRRHGSPRLLAAPRPDPFRNARSGARSLPDPQTRPGSFGTSHPRPLSATIPP